MTQKKKNLNTVNILSFDASSLKHIADDNSFIFELPEIKTINQFMHYYRGSLNNSLDLMHLKSLLKSKKTIYKEMKFNARSKLEMCKTYCDLFINVSFSKPVRLYEENKPIYRLVDKNNKGLELHRYEGRYGLVDITQKSLRRSIYKNGFNVKNLETNEVTHYVHYKRTNSATKTGSCLFIKAEMYDLMMNWTYMNLTIPDDAKIDLAGLMAYNSLTLSGIIDTIKIDSKSILLVDDFKGCKFEAYQSVTQKSSDSGDIECVNMWREVQNICSDGECLLDESIFKENNYNSRFILLRQKFLKSAALNTRIVEFYKDWFKDEYETASIEDKFKREIKVSDIRMIICPSSLKILKFSDVFFQNANNDINESDKKCYEHWISKLDEDKGIFGVVKTETQSPFGFNVNELSYQIINSLPLSKDEVRQLLNYDFDYVRKLKNDIEFFKKHIGKATDAEDEEILTSRAYIYRMLDLHPEFYRTELFKGFRHDLVENYRKRMRKGKIKTQGDYAVQFGNVWELLLSTVKKDITEEDVLHKGRQCYCPRFSGNSYALAIFRFPHINAGNVLYAENVWHERFKYFNLNNNTIIINAYDNDWFDRTQGSDCDSDSLLVISNKLLVKKARECDVVPHIDDAYKCLYPTPVNGIKAEPLKKNYTLKNMADIDHIIAKNNIGRIVNLSQLLNSYYWHIQSKNTNSENDEIIQSLYNYSSICSTLSQIEIDKSKRMYKNIKFNDLLTKVKSLSDKNGESVIKITEQKIENNIFNENDYQVISNHHKDIFGDEPSRITYKNGFEVIKINKKDIDYLPEHQRYITKKDNEMEIVKLAKLVKPKFYRYCSIDKSVDFIPFNTPMDYLQEILSNEYPRAKNVESIDLMEMVIGKGKVNYEQISKICGIIRDMKSSIGSIYRKYSNTDNDEKKLAEREKIISTYRENALKKLKAMKIKLSAIHFLYNKAYVECDKKYTGIALTLFGLLYQAKPDLMESVFSVDKNDKNQKRTCSNYTKYRDSICANSSTIA